MKFQSSFDRAAHLRSDSTSGSQTQDRLDWLHQQLHELQVSNLLRSRKTRESPPVSGLVQMDGQQFINFGSNDYLGIAASAEVVAAVQNTIGQVGLGAGSSPLINGRGTLHRALEADLALFEQSESALLFPTGFAANVGTIGSLVGPGDAVFSDQLNHASIIDGCRLSGAKIFVYPHVDCESLKLQLASSSSYRRRLIVTDGLFSMDGDLAPLTELGILARQFDAMLMVDEAHATGVFGKHGRGVCEFLGCEQDVDVRVGTLSKALGCLGGFVVGSQVLTDWIFNRARPLVFSTAQPEVVAAAARAALRLVIHEPVRRQKVLDLAEHLRGLLKHRGFSIGCSQSQIIPVFVGESAPALFLSQKLMDRGFFVPAVRPPSVPNGQARLRISLSSSHRRDQLQELVDALVDIWEVGAGVRQK